MRSPISSASCWAGSMRAPSSAREQLWGGPAPMTVADYDDFVLWVTLGIILGGRLGYVLFYNPSYFAAHPAGDPAALEGRHVVPRRLSRLRARGRAVRTPARALHPLARRHHLRGRDDRDLSRPHRQFHQRRAVGPADRRALGHGISERRPAAAPSEPALRGRARRACAVRRAQLLDPRAARSSGRASSSARSRSATASRARSASSFASPIRSSGSCGAG